MQTILDPNSNGHGSNFADYPNNQIAPNLASNYFGVPTEYFNNNKGDANKEDVGTEVKTKKKNKHSKRRASKSRRKHDNLEEKENNSSKNIKKNDGDIQQVDRKSNKKSRKRSRKQKTESSTQVTELKNKDNKKTKNIRKKKNEDTRNKNNPVDETKVREVKPRRRHRKPKIDQNTTEKAISDEKTTPNIAEKEVKDGINLAHFNEGMIEESRVPRHPKQEENDILKAFPNMPEDIANTFLTSLPQMNNPMMSNLLANYENIYQSMLSKNNMGIISDAIVTKRRKSKKGKNNRRKTNAKKNKNLTEAPNLGVNSKILGADPKIETVTTERMYVNERTKTNINVNLRDQRIKSFDKTSEIKEKIKVFDDGEIKNENQTIPPSLNPPLNSNDEKTDSDFHYNGYIDDYYPLFTDNAAYNADNNEIYIKDLGDNKYFYATDLGKHFINSRRFENYSFPERVLKDYEVNKKYTDTEKESIRNAFKIDVKEEIKFRTPPVLETPDFQTRRIEKSEIKPEHYYYLDTNEGSFNRFVGDKSSSYSETKTPYYTGTKHNEIKAPKDKPCKDVETLFAKSKVATYGPIYRSDEDSSNAGTTSNVWTDNSYYNDGETTYVLAKSLDYPDVFW